MAAHSESSPVVPSVLPDQPQTGWAPWLRTIAQAINLLGIDAIQRRNDIAAEQQARQAADNLEVSYRQAQATMSGGGTVTWAAGRLAWTNRFLCLPVGGGMSSVGYIQIGQPVTDIPAGQVYTGVARTADATGVVLNAFEALYAAHTPGGDPTAINFYIESYTVSFSAPSNWLLIATINGDDGSAKLGTGQILP